MVIMVPGNADYCSECGAVVPDTHAGIHYRWHESVRGRLVT